MREKIKRLLPKEILLILKHMRYYWLVCLFYLFRIFPIQKKLVVICNVWGIGDNAKYILHELIEEKQKENLDSEIVFITNHPSRYQDINFVKVKKTNSISAVYSLVRARVWVDNNRKENFTRKRNGQYYIQTWHGGIALKKIEKDYEEVLGKAYVKNAKKDSAMTDLYISNSNFCTNMYKNSFWYDGEILECGSPRNDIIIKDSDMIKEKARRNLGITKDVKLAIYAPTYRDSEDMSPYELDHEGLRNSLEERFGGTFVLAVRLHPLISSRSDKLTYGDRVINASNYPDLYELMVLADVMITDYSNIMFEFSYLRKPVFLYAKDVKSYEEERGFYFKYENLPYPIATSQTELLSQIVNYDNERITTLVDKFFEGIQLYESGYASKQVVEVIRKQLLSKEI